jgi:hypothetical protein
MRLVSRAVSAAAAVVLAAPALAGAQEPTWTNDHPAGDYVYAGDCTTTVPKEPVGLALVGLARSPRPGKP